MLPLGARSTNDGDARPLPGGDQRADVVLVVIGLIELERPSRRRQIGDELVVDLLAGIDAAGGGAVLPGIVIAERLHALDHRGEIGVVEHDDRRLAAKLQMRALDRLGRRRAAPSCPVATSPVSEIIATFG